MGDGWETARHPSRPSILFKDKATGLVDSPLKDWGILKLGKPAVDGVARIILDTKHFRGNYPESVLVEGAFVESYVSDDTVPTEANWFTLVPRTRMSPDSEHVFERVLEQLENSKNAVTHVRVSIFPDGGISRVRVYGKA
jgi:allantoicase